MSLPAGMATAFDEGTSAMGKETVSMPPMKPNVLLDFQKEDFVHKINSSAKIMYVMF